MASRNETVSTVTEDWCGEAKLGIFMAKNLATFYIPKTIRKNTSLDIGKFL